MNETLLKVKAFHKDLSVAVTEVAKKYGLVVASDKVRYDEYQWKSTMVFNVQAKSAELRQIEAKAYSTDESDPKIGDTFSYRGTAYRIEGYNKKTNLIVKRIPDERSFIFKRSRFTGKFDYFDKPLTSLQTAKVSQ